MTRTAAEVEGGTVKVARTKRNSRIRLDCELMNEVHHHCPRVLAPDRFFDQDDSRRDDLRRPARVLEPGFALEEPARQGGVLRLSPMRCLMLPNDLT